MRGTPKHLLLVACLQLVVFFSYAQDSSNSFIDQIIRFPDKVFGKVDQQSQKLEQKLVSQTDQYLNKLEKQELRLRRKLWKSDSLKAKEVFGNVEERYAHLRTQLQQKETQPFSSIYSGHADSLTTALTFLNDNPLLQQTKGIRSNLKNVTALQNKFNQTEQIRKQIKARQENLKQQLQNTPVAKQLTRYKKQVYYYQAQLKEYREALNDPELMGAKLMEAAKKIPLFDRFFREHSELAGLFAIPAGDAGSGSVFLTNPALQTRAQVGQMIQQQFAGSTINPQQYIQQNLGVAQTQLNQLKNKIQSSGGGNSEDEVPDFKPNNQKTKSFLKRLEFGSNFQTTSSRTYFPVTTDIAVSIGYKLNSKSIIGVGSSYKLGMGTGWNNISLSHQGIGFRSFLDLKLKGSFWASGGYEQNYLAVFKRLEELNNRTVWKQSALIGMSKIIDVKSTFFKKTKVQLLYDFLWKQQLPQTQAFLFRVGYNF